MSDEPIMRLVSEYASAYYNQNEDGTEYEAVEKAIAALRADNARLTAELLGPVREGAVQKLGERLTSMLDDDQWNNIEPFLNSVLAQEARLTAERDAAVKDAERYRWLRTHAIIWRDTKDRIDFGPGCTQECPEELDSRIDDAMGYSAALEDYCRRSRESAAIDEAMK